MKAILFLAPETLTREARLLTGPPCTAKVDVHAADSCAGGVSLLQNSLRVQSRAHGLQRASKPWETYFYFVGTHHKAGSQLTRNTMKWAFDFLGANYSCQEHHFQHATITSVGGENKCQVSTDCRIHWDNVATQPRVVSNRELAGAGGMKFAHAVRDPKMMLASSYCYHHRGEEYGNPIAPWPDIMFMGPREGLHAVFKGMMKIMINMALIYTKSEADTYHSRYEDMTESSESFDTHVKALFAPRPRSEVDVVDCNHRLEMLGKLDRANPKPATRTTPIPACSGLLSSPKPEMEALSLHAE